MESQVIKTRQKKKQKRAKNRDNRSVVNYSNLDEHVEIEIIKKKIETYLDGRFGLHQIGMFSNWDFDQMVKEQKSWMVKKESIYVYVIANQCPYRTLHARTGTTKDINCRLLQCNGIIQGGPQETKKAAGSWKLVLWIRVPPIRNYSTKHIKKSINEKRGWKSKCNLGILTAIEMGLEWKITADIQDENSKYHADKLYQFVLEQCSISGVDRTSVIF